MDHHYFLLGTTPELSYRELTHVVNRDFGHNTFKKITPEIARTPEVKNPQALLNSLGGVVKTYHLLEKVPSTQKVVTRIVEDLEHSDSPAFVLSSFQSLPLKKLSQSIKNQAKQDGFSARYRLIPHPYYSAGIPHKYQEYHLVKTPSALLILKTQYVQDIDIWSKKDFGRPKADPKSGMLPPKIARIMVNLALLKSPSRKQLLYDPFCGSGTILMEALDVGVSVIGSDISPQAVQATRENLSWYTKEFKSPLEWQVFQKDATQIRQSDVPRTPDAIVFEGYLGPPNITATQVDRYVKGLTNVYLGVLKKANPLLPEKGRVVAALPEYHLGSRVKKLDRLVDTCEKLGYTLSGTPLTYGKPQAKVKRSIITFEKL